MPTFKQRIRGARKSLTIWFNSVAGTLIAAIPFAQDNLPQLQGYLPTNAYQYAMGFVVAANILLRFRTTQGLEHK